MRFENAHIDVEPHPAMEDVPDARCETEPGRRTPSMPPIARAMVLGLTLGLLAGITTLFFATEVRELVYRLDARPSISDNGEKSVAELEAERRQIELRISRLRAKMKKFLPKTSYLIVSTSDNRFELYTHTGLVREGVCSTGSYVLLQGSEDRRWMFETPRGTFRILEKRVNPVWAKPDWAFVEEGLPIPPPGAPERFERGVLGDYALAIGNGYLIHGTLYQRLLGQPVTHGCVRLGDADLDAVFRELSIGSRVFIY